MNSPFTITREFHTTRRRDGQQQLRPGPALDTPKGKIPRISRFMALAIHCDELLFLPRAMEGRGEVQEKDVRKIATELDWKMPRVCFSTIQLQIAGDS